MFQTGDEQRRIVASRAASLRDGSSMTADIARNRGRLLPALVVLFAGCAGIPDEIRALPNPDVVVELIDTPFYPQKRYQCGPAALATALAASDADVNLERLVDKVYIPGRRGSLRVELIAATRTEGRLPFVLDPSLSAILAELEAGRPVVVLQNLGVSIIPRWHYAVVVGIDARQGRVVLRSGTVERRITPIDVFLRTWARGDYWALVTLRPAERPARIDRRRYFDAIVGLEQAGMAAEAARAWDAALDAWPNDPVALFGRANALLASNDPGAATDDYRRLLAIRPHAVAARNNLAMALAEQGRYDAAMAEIRVALASNDDPALQAELLDTLSDVERRRAQRD